MLHSSASGATRNGTSLHGNILVWRTENEKWDFMFCVEYGVLYASVIRRNCSRTIRTRRNSGGYGMDHRTRKHRKKRPCGPSTRPEMLHSSHFLCRNRCSTAFADKLLLLNNLLFSLDHTLMKSSGARYSLM